MSFKDSKVVIVGCGKVGRTIGARGPKAGAGAQMGLTSGHEV